MVGPNDVQDVFLFHEGTFRRYVADPLWPAFKFPLTIGEEVRLASKLKLRLAPLEKFLDDVYLKFKYAGPSSQLKDRTIREISRVAQQLLPETAFLAQSPPIPASFANTAVGMGSRP